jgi:Zn-dependent protease
MPRAAARLCATMIGMENYWNLGRWGRIPVSMHWTVLIALVWLLLFFGDLLQTLIAGVAFFALLVIHEFGHVAVLRWKKLPVESITLYGLHGEVSHGYPRTRGDDIAIAWGGIGAQLLVLIVSVLVWPLVERSTGPFTVGVLAPIYIVFTRLNIFVMILALLPIGPFDGRRAWQVIPWARQKLRQTRGGSDKVVNLTPEKRRDLERRSEKAAQDIIRQLGKKK